MNRFPCAEHAEHGEQQGPGCIRGQPPRRLQVLLSTTHLSLRFSNSGHVTVNQIQNQEIILTGKHI